MEIGDTVMFRLNDNPMSRARDCGVVTLVDGDEIEIEHEGQTYRRPIADCRSVQA